MSRSGLQMAKRSRLRDPPMVPTVPMDTNTHSKVVRRTGTFRPVWRREWDSNPRYGFPHTRFPSVRLKPLGHLSGWPVLKGPGDFCKGLRPRPAIFPQPTE
jgi:hypothetical protein